MDFRHRCYQTRRRALSVLLIASVGVAGCGGGTSSSSTSIVTASETGTSSTTPTPVATSGCRYNVRPSLATGGKRPGLLFKTQYGSLTGIATLHSCWRGIQVPDHLGKLQESRIRLVNAPGRLDDPFRPNGSAMRVELRPFEDPSDPGADTGDVTDTGGYIANRAEVYDRIATRETPARDWPDPVGSVRWYAWSMYLPPGFAESDQAWLDLTQWKGLNSGSPAVAVGTKGSEIVLDGAKVYGDLVPIVTGRWLRFVIGMKLSAQPDSGWITVSVNGRTVVPRRAATTMNTAYVDGKDQVDPMYFKQGIYRSSAWTTTQVAYFGPVEIGTDQAAVQ